MTHSEPNKLTSEQKLEIMKQKLAEVRRIMEFEGTLYTDGHEIEIFRRPKPPERESRWKWLFGHVLKSSHGLRIDYYLVRPSNDVLLCVRGGGHRGYMKITFDWIIAEIERLSRIGDLIYELSRKDRTIPQK